MFKLKTLKEHNKKEFSLEWDRNNPDLLKLVQIIYIYNIAYMLIQLILKTLT